MSFGKVLLLIAVLTVSMLVYQYLGRTSDEIEAEAVVVTGMPAETMPVAVPQEEPALEVALPSSVDEPGCLTVKQLAEHPQLLQDTQRLNSVAAAGPDIDSYRDIDDATLRQFAEQGDAAAMVIVGANAVMRAFDRDQSQSIMWLNGEEIIKDLESESGAASPEASLELNDAAYWFYQAALRGRIFALGQYGSVRSKLFGGPVGLGWINQEDYDVLGVRERKALEPALLYLQVAFDLAPQLREGFFALTINSITETEAQLDIRLEQVRVFETALVDSDLPPIDVPATSTPEFPKMVTQICASEKRSP